MQERQCGQLGVQRQLVVSGRLCVPGLVRARLRSLDLPLRTVAEKGPSGGPEGGAAPSPCRDPLPVHLAQSRDLLFVSSP